MNKVRSFFNKEKQDNDSGHTKNSDYKDEKNFANHYTQDVSSHEVAPQLSVAKSQEFDPITSHLLEEVLEDDYAHITVEDDSPYAEVRVAVPSTDDPTLPQSTIRMWVIGLSMTTLGCGVNLLFSLHAPSFALTTFVTSLLAYPIGLLWAAFMPNYKIFGAELNLGPFNIKEHTVITVMANVRYVTISINYSLSSILSFLKFFAVFRNSQIRKNY